MYCCLACFGPFSPSRDALRSSSVCGRALYAIEGQVIRNSNEWNCSDPPILIAQRDKSHVFHQANVLPVMNEFYHMSLKEKWRNNDTNGYNVRHASGDTVNFNGARPHTWLTVLRQGKTEQRLVTWSSPREIPQMSRLHEVFRNCWVRKNNAVPFVPNVEHMLSICQPCNQIMTQLGTTSELLVRSRVVTEPLVPSRSIEYYTASRTAAGVSIRGFQNFTPTYQNNETRDFTYQACLAYAIHRCLPASTFVQPPGCLLNQENQDRAHKVFSAFGFILIEIVSLMVESTYGTSGGRNALVKPRYRYRALIELYISYLLWILIKNDIPHGEPDGSAISACVLDFQTFHRYYFNSFIDAIVVAFPDYAHVMFITDVLFTKNWMVAGAMPFTPGMDMGDAAEVLGYVAASIAEFYDGIVRPYFSRHIAGLLPDQTLAVQATEGQYLRQITIYNMIIAIPDLITLLHVCERGVNGDTDSFLNLVGVHAVLSPWDKMLMSAPQRATRLLENLINSLTLQEYRNIMETLNVKEKSAETIYLECCALDPPTDPRDLEELVALKQAPKCTAAKAAVRLIQCGAFIEVEGGEPG